MKGGNGSSVLMVCCLLLSNSAHTFSIYGGLFCITYVDAFPWVLSAISVCFKFSEFC